MNCPKCGRLINNGSKFCSYCGAEIEVSLSERVDNTKNIGSFNPTPMSVHEGPVQQAADPNGLTPENYRQAPTYKKYLTMLNVFLFVGFVFSGLALLGSLLMRFGDEENFYFGLVSLILGLVGGIAFLIVGLSFNKKVFPQVDGYKIKGFFEVCPAILTAFAACCIVGALVVQGIYIIVY